MRAPLTSVSPLLTPLRDDLGLGDTAVGVLTSLPVLCLGLFAFAARRLQRRWSGRTLLVLSLLVLALGGLIRSDSSAAALFVGTVLVAAPIGIANVLIPGLIKRRFPRSVPRVSALYSGALTLGAAGAPAVAVPLAQATGSSWRLPLLLLAVPVALVTVAVVLRAVDREPPEPTGEARRVRLWGSPLAWQVTVIFGA
ncbi:MFS transporter [Streptomyces sp. NPDC057596]|uniref:MFS transporter n=1 Tax=Streptomyces sp. NPDC057596 TaxID=3346178 RepID=UPI0036B59DB6